MKVAFLAENLGRMESSFRMSADQIMASTGHNVGNLAFWYAANRLLEAEPYLVGWHTKPKDVPSDVRAFVIPAANFLNVTADLSRIAELVKGLDVPVLLVGIGAQSESKDEIPILKQGVIDFLNEVSIRAPYIGVRGDYSKAVCGKYGVANAKVMGCPSLFINSSPDLGIKIQRKIETLDVQKIAVHAACIKGPLANIERELTRYVLQYPGSAYVIQRPPELIKLMHDEALTQENAEYVKKCADFLALGSTDESRIRNFMKTFGYVPEGIESWALWLRSFSCGINTRIHGTMIGLSAELPSICIWHDTRTYELAKRMRVPTISGEGFLDLRHRPKELFNRIKFDGKDFDDNRLSLAKQFRALIEEVGLVPSQHLKKFT
jgi:hypothetical protein